MPADWKQLRHETAAAQVTFLDAEANTGITLARIALSSTDSDKSSRNAVNARKAYDTLVAHMVDLPAGTPGLEGVQKKMATLEHLLHSLEDRS